MIVEIRTGRGWKIWIDGVCPTQEWELGEPEDVREGQRGEQLYRYTTTQDNKPLHVDPYFIEWIGFDTKDDEWETDHDGVRLGPADFWIKFADIEHPIYGKIETAYWINPDKDPGNIGVQLDNGEWIGLDETNAYVRAEVEV